MAGELLLSFYGDDFTGSTDAMESLALNGVRTVLFTDPPTPEQLGKYPGLMAFGMAGLTRSLPADEMERTLRPVFASLRGQGAPIVHYKVCSTFDSSPTIGNIGRVIDVGSEVFASKFVPVVVGAPSLGRYCVFGNLFARCGAESEPIRLDRHPSMSRHPVTPMNEADLRLHLAKQTSKSIGLLDVLKLDLPAGQLKSELDRIVAEGSRAVLIDVLNDQHLAKIGALLEQYATGEHPLFVVGSSGVESALCAHWRTNGEIQGSAKFETPGSVGPILAICGSCSPVTAGQIKWASENGFTEISLDVRKLDEIDAAVERAGKSIKSGKSVCIHTGGRSAESKSSEIGAALGRITKSVLRDVSVHRVLVAGGDTSSQIARVLGIEAVEMIGELTRGSPLCRASAPGSVADGLEITFKGGQIGNKGFFGVVEAKNSPAT